MPDEPIFREARLQDKENRQNSLDIDDDEMQSAWLDAQYRLYENAQQAYQSALNAGIAKEVARAILPEGITPSRLYMAGSIRSWLHYIEVRTDPTTQKEHRIIAAQCAEVLADAIPELSEFIAQ